jgi:hypothetical protein
MIKKMIFDVVLDAFWIVVAVFLGVVLLREVQSPLAVSLGVVLIGLSGSLACGRAIVCWLAHKAGYYQ